MIKRIARYGLNTLLILLLAVWMLHFMYPVYYSVAVLKVHNEQKDILDHRSVGLLEKVCLDLGTFEKYYDRQSKELNINGDFYDVAGLEKTGNTITCYVLKDAEETCLNKNISTQLQHQQNAKNSKLAYCWLPVVLLYSSYNTRVFYSDVEHKEFSSFYDIYLNKGYLGSAMRPPRFA